MTRWESNLISYLVKAVFTLIETKTNFLQGNLKEYDNLVLKAMYINIYKIIFLYIVLRILFVNNK